MRFFLVALIYLSISYSFVSKAQSKEQINYYKKQILQGGSDKFYEAPDYIRKSKDVVSYILDKGVLIIPSGTPLWNDRDIIVKVVKLNGMALQYAPPKFLDDKGVVLAAVKNASGIFQFISERLRDDKDVVYTALKSSPFIFKHIGQRFKDDEKLVFSVAKKNISVFEEI